jgi:hypothetical protein
MANQSGSHYLKICFGPHLGILFIVQIVSFINVQFKNHLHGQAIFALRNVTVKCKIARYPYFLNRAINTSDTNFF